MGVHVGADGLFLLVGDLGNDLKDFFRASGDNARGRGGLNALESTGVGHHHAFDVLDDIAAGFHQHLFRLFAQHLPGLGGAIGQRDRLGTAHGGDQLLMEDLDKVVVSGIGSFHTFPSFLIDLAVLRHTTKRTAGRNIFGIKHCNTQRKHCQDYNKCPKLCEKIIHIAHTKGAG